MEECMKIFKHLVVGNLQEDQTKEGVLLANRLTGYSLVLGMDFEVELRCTRVFTRSQPPAATPRRRSVSSVPAPARTTPATTAEPTPMEMEEAAALPTRNQPAADTQAASTSTFKLPECPPHLLPAFTAYRASVYKEALERAAKTGVMETGIPRAEEVPEPEPSNVSVRRKTGKKRKKGELRGPNWAVMEFGGSGEPVFEDSGMKDETIFNDLDEGDNDDLQLNHGEDS
ncbi:hypothetical protein KQX54_014383 [Cotesia glomerata]|uniref:Uncharacterized protein n=1 Tax=Cotesia glomerata TaxID=32391 RepID=A0AAV7HU29_COTGL|nr:hypothetical protein KQX54_014383 [Cotesia glomerata]